MNRSSSGWSRRRSFALAGSAVSGGVLAAACDMAASGTSFDLVDNPADAIINWAARSLLVDLQPLAHRVRGLDLNQYWRAAVDSCRYKGGLYGIPWAAPTQLLWCNKTLFDKAGRSYPTRDWGWDQFLAAARATTRRSPAGEIEHRLAPLRHEPAQAVGGVPPVRIVSIQANVSLKLTCLVWK